MPGSPWVLLRTAIFCAQFHFSLHRHRFFEADLETPVVLDVLDKIATFFRTQINGHLNVET